MNRFFEFLRRIFHRRRKAAAPISIKFSAVGFEECSESLRAASDAMRSLGQAAKEVSKTTEATMASISPSRQLALDGKAFAEGFSSGVIITIKKCDRIHAALPMPRICAMLIAIEASPEDIHKLSTSKKIRLRKKIYHKTLRRIRIQAKRRNTHD